MVAFGHTAVGTIIGVASYSFLSQYDIALALVLTGLFGVASHYLMDSIPHGHYFKEMDDYDKKISWIILFDALLPFSAILVLAHFLGKSPVEILYILFAIGGAQLPDVIDGLKQLRLLPEYKILKIESRVHQNTHWHGRGSHLLLMGQRDIWQVLTFVLAVLILIK